MATLSKLTKELRLYFIKIAIYGTGVWLGVTLLAAVVIYFFMGFIGIPDLKRNIGSLVVVLAGVIQIGVHLVNTFRQAKRAAQEIERKESERINPASN